MYLEERADGKIEVKVPVTYTVFGKVEMTFENIPDMLEKLNNKDFIRDMELPDEDAEYVMDSFEVDYDEVLYASEEHLQSKKEE